MHKIDARKKHQKKVPEKGARKKHTKKVYEKSA